MVLVTAPIDHSQHDSMTRAEKLPSSKQLSDDENTAETLAESNAMVFMCSCISRYLMQQAFFVSISMMHPDFREREQQRISQTPRSYMTRYSFRVVATLACLNAGLHANMQRAQIGPRNVKHSPVAYNAKLRHAFLVCLYI